MRTIRAWLGVPLMLAVVSLLPSHLSADKQAAALVLGAGAHFVSPSGSQSGDGSQDHPWDLATALKQPASVQPGDTIYLRAGIYRGPFVSTLTGTTASPITVRAYPGERVTIDGKGTDGHDVLGIQGAWATYRDLEITNSDTLRSTNIPGPWPSDLPRNAPGVRIYKAGNRIINCVIHDDGTGVGYEVGGAGDGEVTGNLIFFNGWQGPDRGHGHGLYGQNATDTRRIKENIVFENFDHGYQIYGSENPSAALNNFYLEGNVLFDNGRISREGNGGRNILLGGGNVAKNPTLISNYTYYTGGGSLNQLGYAAGCINAVVTDNIFIGGGLRLVAGCQVTSMTGNIFQAIEGFTASMFPSNTYLTGPFTGARIAVRPNPYEPGRANIIIFNGDQKSVVDVDLSPSGLQPGQAFEIHDAQNFYGPAVWAGLYSAGQHAMLTMTGLTMARPVGNVPRQPSHTPIDFGVFVVLPVTAGTPTPPPVNQAPSVNAGRNDVITLPNTATLSATASDDGLPNPPGAITLQWSKLSGPGAVTFGAPTALVTSASFSQPGTYTLRLTASDGALSASGDVTVKVLGQSPPTPPVPPTPPTPPTPPPVQPPVPPTPPPTPTNQRPSVKAGDDQTITLPAMALLHPTVTDDGLPNPPGKVTITWSKLSGPGSVTFSIGLTSMTATFSVDGTYLLRVTASDSALEASDDVMVTVLPASPVPPTDNQPPVVEASVPSRVVLPAVATITGTVHDDGRPNPPGKVTTQWSAIGGPGHVTFGDATALTTTATFSAPGEYRLQLTASDGALSASDAKTITAAVVGTPPPPVTPPPRPATNRPPIVRMGERQILSGTSLPVSTVLQGSVEDDGLPANQALHIAWTMLRGPAAVAFANPQDPHTAATFPAIGEYLLSLTADDGQLKSSRNVYVKVLPTRPASSQHHSHLEVNAGDDLRFSGTVLPASTALQGRVELGPTDELHILWSQSSGPAPVRFENPADPHTRATFPAVGEYRLLLTGKDAHMTRQLWVRIVVLGDGLVTVNRPPVVDAGPAQQLTATALPISTTVEGKVQDDGLPKMPGAIAVTWSKRSGPGVVTFGDAAALKTTVSFSLVGIYQLQLAASDGELRSAALVQITITGSVTPPPSSENHAPTVSAGQSQTVTLPASATLDGQAVDDGLPNPPGKLTVKWEQISGPASVLFADASMAKTVATFTQAGAYVLRLTASDGSLSTSAEITVQVKAAVEPPTSDPARLTITAPTAGESIHGQTVTVKYAPVGDLAAAHVNHVHFQLDGQPEVRDLDFDGTYVFANVSAGAHTLRGYLAHADHTKVDGSDASVSFSTTIDSPPPPPSNGDKVYLQQEAESGTVTAPMAVLAHARASQGHYVASPVKDTGTVAYSFAVPKSGTYVLWCRIHSTFTDKDSFYVSIDGSGEDVFDTAEHKWSDLWQWTVVNGRAGKDPLNINPRRFDLTTGTHTFLFRSRDPNTDLDRLILTDDLSFTPKPDDAGSPPPSIANQPPAVDAGLDETVAVNEALELNGTVADDGRGPLTAQWKQIGGSGSATFDNAVQPHTMAHFSQPGSYTLQLTGSDGTLSTNDTMVATVTPAAPPSTGKRVNVRDFGAKGDGTTNDVPAIQAAANAAKDGDTIYFPAGDYFINDAVKLNHRNRLTFEGDGPSSVIHHGARIALMIGTGGEPGDGFIVQKLKFIGLPGHYRKQGGSGGIAIQIFGPNGTIVRDCDFEGVGNAVFAAGTTAISQGTRIERCRVKGWGSVAIFCNGGERVRQCQLVQDDPDLHGEQSSHGIYIHSGSRNVEIVDTLIENARKYAAQVYGEQVGTTTLGVRFTRVHVKNCANGITIQQSQPGAADAKDVVISDSVFEGVYDGPSLSIKQGDGILVANNMFDTGDRGLQLGVWAPYEPNFTLTNLRALGNTIQHFRIGLWALASNGGKFKDVLLLGNTITNCQQAVDLSGLKDDDGIIYRP